MTRSTSALAGGILALIVATGIAVVLLSDRPRASIEAGPSEIGSAAPPPATPFSGARDECGGSRPTPEWSAVERTPAEPAPKEEAAPAATAPPPEAADPIFGFFATARTLAQDPLFNPCELPLDRAQRNELGALIRSLNEGLAMIDRMAKDTEAELFEQKLARGDFTRVPATRPGEQLQMPPVPRHQTKYGIRVRSKADRTGSGDRLVMFIDRDQEPQVRAIFEERERVFAQSVEEVRAFFAALPMPRELVRDYEGGELLTR